MAKQSINIGSTANDGTGSTLRDGGDLINDNFNEIYTKLGDGSTLTSAITATATTLTLSNTSFASFQIKDTSEDHTYNFTVNELAANRNVELPLLGSDDVFVFEAHTQTLTNKTLTTPIANAGIQLKNGATSAGFLEFFEDSDNGTNKVTLIGPASTGDVTLTLPSATDTLVGKDTTDTLTNKTLTNAKRTWITKTNSDSPYTASAGDLIFVDTSGGVVTVTLPASPSVGDEVRFIDSTASFDSNALTVGRNSEKIQGDAADLTVNTERAGLGLAYSGSSNGWLLIEK